MTKVVTELAGMVAVKRLPVSAIGGSFARVLALVAAEISYFLIERPALSLRQKVIR